MQVSSTNNSQVGFAIFDAWMKSVEKRIHANKNKNIASPLVDAAFQAFNAYAATVEAGNNAQIAAVSSQVNGGTSSCSSYAPNSSGGVSPTSNLAPFYALNVLA